MGSRIRAVIPVIAVIALTTGGPAVLWPAPARAEARTVTVATHPIDPFVTVHGTDHSGFTVDIWDEIAKREGWTTRFIDTGNVADQLADVANGRADVAAGAVSITSDRERDFDFSEPILGGGLQIMVSSKDDKQSSPGLEEFLHLLASRAVLVWVGTALLLALIPAHILWFFERRDAESGVSRSYFPGIFQSAANVLGSLLTVGDPSSARHWAARLLAIIVAFTGIIFVAFYTATLTSNLTVAKIGSGISGPADLYGKKVLTVGGTTSANYLRTNGIPATEEATPADAFHALGAGGYDALVFDAPVLQYYASHAGSGSVEVTGPVFEDEDYALAFRNGDPLRKQVDEALIAMREDGTYDTIKQKWFGTEQSTAGAGG